MCCDRSFGPILLGQLLPPFPNRDWDKGHMANDPQTGHVDFVKAESVSCRSGEPLAPREAERVGFHATRPSEATSPHFNASRTQQRRTRTNQTCRLAWEIGYMEAETAAYQRINDSGIGPKFFRRLTEGKDGRVVGFVTEWVQGARAAGPGDIEGCTKALRRLHELGIKSGDINKYNFLVRDGYDVVLVDFETAERDCSPDGSKMR